MCMSMCVCVCVSLHARVCVHVSLLVMYYYDCTVFCRLVLGLFHMLGA